MTHRCHATGCSAEVPPAMFMCRAHWYALPKERRDAVWATYRPGQERSKDPSLEYLEAASAAVAWLEVREGRRAWHPPGTLSWTDRRGDRRVTPPGAPEYAAAEMLADLRWDHEASRWRRILPEGEIDADD